MPAPNIVQINRMIDTNIQATADKLGIDPMWLHLANGFATILLYFGAIVVFVLLLRAITYLLDNKPPAGE